MRRGDPAVGLIPAMTFGRAFRRVRWHPVGKYPCRCRKRRRLPAGFPAEGGGATRGQCLPAHGCLGFPMGLSGVAAGHAPRYCLRKGCAPCHFRLRMRPGGACASFRTLRALMFSAPPLEAGLCSSLRDVVSEGALFKVDAFPATCCGVDLGESPA